MLSGNDWKHLESILRANEPVKFPSIRSGTPQKLDQSKKSSIQGTRRHNPHRSQSEVAEEVARSRFGTSVEGIPTLGLFKSSFIKPTTKTAEFQIEHSSTLPIPKQALHFSSQKATPNYTYDPRPEPKDYRELPKYLGISERHLPLDLFVEETIKYSELLKEGFENEEKKCRGRTRFEYANGKIEWIPVEVFSFDEATKRFHIKLMENGLEKYVRRYNLLFDIEDEDEFFQRRDRAIELRKEARKRLTKELFIATNMRSLYSVEGMSIKTIEGVYSRIGIDLDRYSKESVEKYLLQIHAMHDYGILKANFNYFYNEPGVQNALIGLSIDPPSPIEQSRAQIRGFHLNYVASYTKLQKSALISNNFMICCLQDIQDCYLSTISRLTMFEFPTSKPNAAETDSYDLPVILKDFITMQRRVIFNFKVVANNVWTVKSGESIRKRLSTIMDLNDKDLSYDSVKPEVKKLLRLIKFRMEAMANECLDTSLRTFEDFVMSFSARKTSAFKKDVNKKAQQSPFINVNIVIGINKKTGARVIETDPHLEGIIQDLWSLPEGMCDALSNLEAVDQWVFTNIGSSPVSFLANPDIDTHPFLSKIATSVKLMLKNAIMNVERLLDKLKLFEYILNSNIEDIKKQINQLSDHLSGDSESIKSEGMFERKIAEFLLKLVKDYWEIRQVFVGYYDFGMISVNMEEIRLMLISEAELLQKPIINILTEDLKKDVVIYTQQFENMHEKSGKHCTSIDEVSETLEFLATAGKEVEDMRKKVWESSKKYENLIELNITIESPYIEKYIALFHWPKYLLEFFALRKKELALANETLVKEMNAQKEKIQGIITDFAKDFEQFKTYGRKNKELPVEYVEDLAEKAKLLKGRLKNIKEETDIINRRETLLNFEISQYRDLNKLIENAEPYFEVWKLGNDFKRSLPIWFESSISRLNIEKVYNSVSLWVKSLSRLEELFLNSKRHLKVVKVLFAELEVFRGYLPLITSLTTQGLRERHWKEFREKLRIALNPDLILSLSDLISLDLHQPKQLTIITEIAERASREMTIEKTLDALEAEWTSKEFNLLRYRDIYLLTHAEDLQLQVDDNIMKVQTLRSSPFVAPFRDKVMNWEKNLRQITDLLNEWVRVQKYWLYLEPIFGSKDMSSQMNAEAKKFNEVDADIRKMINIVHDSRSVLAVACSEMSIAYFIQCNEGCEKILRSLRNYLDVKRTVFPRFYFLSDDEMLDLQSHTQNPRSVQKQLHKCFQAVSSVIFSEDNYVIGVRSLEKETMMLLDSIIPTLSLEDWLEGIEYSIAKTLKEFIKTAFETPKRRYHEWPNQANIEAQNILWTLICSRIIQGEGFAVLFEEYLEDDDLIDVPRRNAPRTSFFNEFKRRLEKEVVKLIALVRTSYNRAHRYSYSNQAQLFINQRDNIDSLMTVVSEDDFTWQVLIKHYLENDKLMVRSMDKTFMYMYEYIGTSQRLVITPLTARAQSSLLLAAHLRFAGSPEGPAGTGKTETTKELARVVAVYCLVFNCSEGVDAFSMASFFKGLAICGAWSCFDEFNRIDSEVLSVVSQQILSISMSLRARLADMEFEGNRIKLHQSFAVFATMNPFYKGRTQLPDSVKSLLRPVSMTVPDYLMIAQISLYSFGFRLSKSLAHRISTVFKLCEEQLSTQDHYEFGLRTLKSVLIAASNLRARAHADSKVPISLIRRFAGNSASHEALVNSGKITDDKTALSPEVELGIILRSLYMCNKPKLVGQDEKIFRNILEDVFPGVKFNEIAETDLHRVIAEIIKENNYSSQPEFAKKVYQIYETLAVRHGIMLVGESMTGKTTSLNILHEALNRLKANELAERLLIWTKTEAKTEEAEFYKALITSFKELQIDIDTIEEMRFKEYLPFLSLQELKAIRNQCEHPGVLQLSLNPKAHFLSRLFGAFDTNTREWQDGLAASIMRKLMFEGTKRMKWLVFDGPIDIFWVENLNTALDDNKKLCLTSGETILIGTDMSLIFEVDSLEHASPATVSRCGMIFYDHSLVPLTDVFANYTKKQIPELLKDYSAKLEQMFKWIMVPCLEIIKKVEVNFPVTDYWIVSSFICLLDSLLNYYRNMPGINNNELESPEFSSDINITAGNKAPKESKNNQGLSASALLSIESAFIFSTVWTVGALMVHSKDKEAFDEYLRDRVGIEDLNDDLPSISSIRKNIVQSATGMAGNYFNLPEDTMPRPNFALPLKRKIKVFDMVYDKDRKDWIRFEELNSSTIGDLGNEKDSPELMIVPTNDITKTFYLIELLADAKRSLLLAGPTGTGKSVLLKQFMAKCLKTGDSITSMINFTATITSESFQKRIESKLERHRKGILAPVLGKHLVIIAEDIHMASQDEHGVHTTLELLRQWFDYGGWFDMKFSDFRKLENLFYIAAMTPRLGNEKSMSYRILRHFSIITMGQPTDRTFHEIFETIYSEISRKFSERATRGIEDRMVAATLDLYRKVEEEFKPTPNRVHYTFNIRDVGNVFKGMSLCNPKTIRKKDNLIRLWYHEGLRIFYDRLVDDHDRVSFLRVIDAVTIENFKSLANSVIGKELPPPEKEGIEGYIPVAPSELLKSKTMPIFGVLFRGGGTIQDYTEIKSLDMATESLKSALDKYNQENPPINLVIFDYIIEHMLRICRVIKTPQSHCLLVGVGGSGKHSLAKLAAFMFSYSIYTIDLKYQYSPDDWRDDIKKILYSAGVDQNKGVFVIYESQIVNEAFLEDLHNFLNSGEIPLLFTNEEVAKIIGNNNATGESDKVADWHKFVTSCKNNLTVAICMSPVGGKFRQRVRLFPALVNCTTIDWFLDWPNEGLSSVANFYLQNVQDIPENIVKGVAHVCAKIFSDVTLKADELLHKEGRYVYNTPQNFIDFLRAFSNLLVQKKNFIESVRKTYDSSLTLLHATKEELKNLQENLKAQEKDLGKHESDLKEIIKVVEEQEVELEGKQSQVAIEEAIVSKEVNEAETMRAECQAQLDIVMPELDNAREALKKLTKYEISELKAMNKPPLPVKMVLEAVCIILGVPPARYKKGGEFVEDYWMAAMGKKVLGDQKILDKLVTFDKVIISKNIIEKLENFIKNPEFDPEVASHASEAAKGMCLWVRAMVNLNYVQREIKPKEKALAEAQKHCDVLKKQLKIKKKELKGIQSQMEALLTEKSKKEVEREAILQTIRRNKKKIDRAEKLIGGLGGEMQRWTVTTRLLASGLVNLVGDTLLGASFITFLGPFPRAYREVCLEKWQTMITQHGVNNSQSFNLISMFSDPVSVREWIANELPNDDYSVENVLILNSSLKYSICIDPQAQAYRWLLNTFPDVNITRFFDPKFISSMESAIQFGYPIIIQIDENVDPVMLPLLMKEYTQNGSLRFSDMDLRFHPNFQLFLTTRLNNPHYHPELCSIVSLLNFAINPDGLYDQVLALIVSSERRELEERHITLINQSTQNKKELKNLESQIVEQLSTFQGDILEDEDLVAHLNALKQTAEDIAQRIRNSEKTEKRINKARDIYSSVATRATSLFFSVLDIAKVRPIYQFSLKWFLRHCQQVLKNTTDSTDDNKRVIFLINSLTIHLHKKVCTSLFDNDKLLFSVLLSFKIITTEEKVTKELISYLLDDGVERIIEESPVDFLTNEMWCKVRELSAFYPFKDPLLSNMIIQNSEQWKKVYMNSDKPELEAIPGVYHLCLPTDQKAYEIKGREEGDVSSLFQYTQKRFEKRKTLEASLSDRTKKIFVYMQRMCVLKAIRNERLMQAYELLISVVLGPEFLEPDPSTLESSFEESTPTNPVLIFHTYTSDPVSELFTLCKRVKKEAKIMTLSLGLGKIITAIDMIERARVKGKWLLLQNIHLCPSFMPSLEDTLDKMNASGTHRNFRLWLTSHPDADLPISIIQSCIKVTMEPATGIKISLLRNLNAVETHIASADEVQKRLIFGLCFAHSVIQERCRYIGVGWSRPYDFTESDYLASASVMLSFSGEKFGWDLLRFSVIDLTYGGRLSEPQDQRLIQALLKPLLSPEIKNPDFTMCEGQVAFPEKMDNFKLIYTAVEKMDLVDSPEIYGLHSNQVIKLQTREGERILELLSHIRKSALLIEKSDLKKQSGSDSLDLDVVSKQNRGKILQKICSTIIDKVPKPFDLESIKEKYPVKYEDSLNTVLQEEIMRYNRLLDRVHSTTSSVYHAASGYSFMSLELEEVSSDLLLGRVPQKWKQFSYPSAKNLAGYTENLVQRMNYMKLWIAEGAPDVFWFPGMFYPQSYLTAVLQNFSRTKSLKMEELEFKHSVIEDEDYVKGSDSCLLEGITLEAARWEGKIVESRYKEFAVKMPRILFEPVEKGEKREGMYECPMYKTVLRVGTQGQEANFITHVMLDTDVDVDHWLKRGVALILEYDSV